VPADRDPFSKPEEQPPEVRPGLTERVRAHALALGFDRVGITNLTASDHADLYHDWIRRGLHGEMAYLGRPDAVERRLRPDRAWPELRSAVVVALNYFPGGESGAPPGDVAAGRGIIARYAHGRDYHKVLKKKLLALLAAVEAEVGRELPAARAYVDTGPVLERELARRAGLGWFGRNTMLIDPRRGSYFFLGSLLLEMELEADAPFVADHCGSCNACVPACPTGALLGRDERGAPVMDATRCISYLTIEQRGAIPRELRPLVGNRVFGCDICQEVCPWNGGKFVQITAVGDFLMNGRERDRERKRKRKRGGEAGDSGLAEGRGRERERLRGRERLREGPGAGSGAELPGAELPSLISLMGMTYEEWDEWTMGSAMRRSGYAGLRRNVAVALGNWGAEEAVPVLVEALADPEPLVRGHAAWALGEIGSVESVSALEAVESSERDSFVREELEAARALRRSKER
jgi:epoxyqueuosine reductase